MAGVRILEHWNQQLEIVGTQPFAVCAVRPDWTSGIR
jgi:hypothetical protein